MQFHCLKILSNSHIRVDGDAVKTFLKDSCNSSEKDIDTLIHDRITFQPIFLKFLCVWIQSIVTHGVLKHDQIQI